MKAVSVATLVTATVMLVLVGGLSLWRGRLWCNTICPVGTVLGFVSRWSLMKPMIDKSKCNGCHRCGKNCKAECIDVANGKVDQSRCVRCFNCLGACKKEAMSCK